MFNSTSSSDKVINNVYRSFVFVFIILPTSVLSGLCVVAILLAKAINLPMRVLLLNIFATLFHSLLALSAFELVPSSKMTSPANSFTAWVLQVTL